MSPAHIVVTILLAAAGIYAIMLGLFWFGQRSLIYPAPPAAAGVSPPADATLLMLGPDDAAVEAWYLPPIVDTGPAALLIVAHGNAKNFSKRSLLSDWSTIDRNIGATAGGRTLCFSDSA